MSAFIIIQGNIGRAPEIKTLPGTSTEVAEFSVGVNNYQGKGKDSTVTWFNVKVFGKPAEWVRDWQKGAAVLVNGELEQREWTDRDGAKRASLEVRASKCENLSKFINAKGDQSQAASERPASAPRPEPKIGDGEDDLPF